MQQVDILEKDSLIYSFIVDLEIETNEVVGLNKDDFIKFWVLSELHASSGGGEVIGFIEWCKTNEKLLNTFESFEKQENWEEILTKFLESEVKNYTEKRTLRSDVLSEKMWKVIVDLFRKGYRPITKGSFFYENYLKYVEAWYLVKLKGFDLKKMVSYNGGNLKSIPDGINNSSKDIPDLPLIAVFQKISEMRLNCYIIEGNHRAKKIVSDSRFKNMDVFVCVGACSPM